MALFKWFGVAALCLLAVVETPAAQGYVGARPDAGYAFSESPSTREFARKAVTMPNGNYVFTSNSPSVQAALDDSRAGRRCARRERPRGRLSSED